MASLTSLVLKPCESSVIVNNTVKYNISMNQNISHKYSDKEIVEGIIGGNHQIFTSFFCNDCKGLFIYIHTQICNRSVEVNEIANEIILYLSSNGWSKLRTFDYRSKLITWLTVVTIRYYRKFMSGMIEIPADSTLIVQPNGHSTNDADVTEAQIDVYRGLNRMPNQRYRMVIEKLDLLDMKPETLAAEMNISTANLYNIHRRALQQLKFVMFGKEIAL